MKHPAMSFEMESRVRSAIERLEGLERSLHDLEKRIAAGDEDLDEMAREARRLAGICGQQARSLSERIQAEIKFAELEAERQRIMEAIRDIKAGTKTLDQLNLGPKEKLAVALACSLPLPPPYTSSDEAWADLNDTERQTVAHHNPQFKKRENKRER